jgi:hypothetical protein
VSERQAIRIAGNGTGFTARERRDSAQVACPKSLPGRAVVGKKDVAGNLQDDETEGEDVGRLVKLSAENLGSDILAIAFTFNALGGRPARCEAEIADLEVTIESDKDVGGLDIKVDKACLVNGR